MKNIPKPKLNPFLPGVIAIVIAIFNWFYYRGHSENSPLNAAFSIMMGFWATFFITCWNRHERELKILWGNLENDGDTNEATRPEFVGTLRIDPITERNEQHFSDWQRFFRYI